MAITLGPELEAMMEEDAAALGFASAEDYVRAQLTQIHQSEVWLRENGEQVSALIDEGIESAERGELLSPEDSKESLAKFKQEWLAKRNVAA